MQSNKSIMDWVHQLLLGPEIRHLTKNVTSSNKGFQGYRSHNRSDKSVVWHRANIFKIVIIKSIISRSIFIDKMNIIKKFLILKKFSEHSSF